MFYLSFFKMLNAYINHYQILSLQAKPPIRLLTSLPWVTYFDNSCRLIVDEVFAFFSWQTKAILPKENNVCKIS